MDLIRLISSLFNEQAEETHRIVIITKDPNKSEIEKHEKDIKKKKMQEEMAEKTQINPHKDDI